MKYFDLKFKNSKLFMIVICLLSIFIGITSRECNPKNGCISLRKAYYYSSEDFVKESSLASYHNVYLMKNALVVTKSDNSQTISADDSKSNESLEIVKKINYLQIILSCGESLNKACLYSSSIIKETQICFTVEYYGLTSENNQKQFIYICLPKDYYKELILLKESLSNTAEQVKIKESKNRYSVYNGIQKSIYYMKTWNEDQITTTYDPFDVKVQVRNNMILFWTGENSNKSKQHYSVYSLYEIGPFPKALGDKITGFAGMIGDGSIIVNFEKVWKKGIREAGNDADCFRLYGETRQKLVCVNYVLNKDSSTSQLSQIMKNFANDVHSFTKKFNLYSTYFNIKTHDLNKPDDTKNYCNEEYWMPYRDYFTKYEIDNKDNIVNGQVSPIADISYAENVLEILKMGNSSDILHNILKKCLSIATNK